MGFVLKKSFITDSFTAAVYNEFMKTSPIKPRDSYFDEEEHRNIAQGYALSVCGLPDDFDLTPYVEKFRAAADSPDDKYISTLIAHCRAYFSVWASRFLSISDYHEGYRNVYLESITYCYPYTRSDGSDSRKVPPTIDLEVYHETVETSLYNSIIGDLGITMFDNVEDFPVEVLAYAEMMSKEFDELPWKDTLEPIPGHYARISKKFPGQVSYYESPERMAIGRRLCVKPGRYLTKFYPDMNPQAIRSWAAKTANFFKLQYADKADDIISVYQRGPDSCMSRDIDGYDCDTHPVTAYESPDLKLAYIGNDSKVSARAIVWPEKKLVGRIYGDWDRLIPLLKADGYTIKDEDCPNEDYHTFEGARLKYIPYDEEENTVVFPYIDGTHHAYYDGEYMVLGEPSDKKYDVYECQSDSGLAYGQEKVWVADIEEYHTPGWVDENAAYSNHFDEYVVNYRNVVHTIYQRYAEVYRFDTIIGEHRQNTWRCELDGFEYLNDVRPIEYNGHMIPEDAKEYFIRFYNLDNTKEEDAA